MAFIIILLGFAFGFFLQYSKVNTYNTISGMAVLKDFTVAKTIATAIGFGVIMISLTTYFGLASFHIKAFVVGNILIGGLVFGVGMAILGYCPGTIPVSLGQGSLDALIGLIGGFVASIAYTLLSPYLHQSLGANLGKLFLSDLTGSFTTLYFVLSFLIAGVFIAISFWLHRLEKAKDSKWFISALGIAVVAALIFSISDRVLGASSFYPYAADSLVGLSDHDYFIKSAYKSGSYEMKFLLGAFLAGLVFSLINGSFQVRLIHSNWSRLKGDSSAKRIIWAFVGGFLLLFGARLAGGCTSGHVISGGMQLAASSLVFAIFVFAGFLITGKLFYRK